MKHFTLKESAMKKLLYYVSVVIVLLSLTSVPVKTQSLSVYDIDVSNFPTVKIRVFVFDQNGNLLRNLSPAQFQIVENGNPRTVSTYSCGPQSTPCPNLSAVLTVDVSGSMDQGAPRRIDLAKSAAKAFVRALALNVNECAATSFDQLNYLNCDFTRDTTRLLNAINGLAPLGGTDYDMGFRNSPAGGLVVAQRSQPNNRRVLVFLTDGLGAGNEAAITSMAQSNNIKVYCIAVGMGTPQILKNICTATNGQWFDNVNQIAQAEAIYRQISSYEQCYPPCELSYTSALDCNQNRSVTITIPSLGISQVVNYALPTSLIPRLSYSKTGVSYGGVPPATTRDSTVVLTAQNGTVTVNSGSFSNTKFSVVNWGGSSPPFTLSNGQTRTLTVRFSPIDSSMQFGSLSLNTNACNNGSFVVSGGYASRTVATRTLAVVEPNGGENYSTCDSMKIRWSGIQLSDTVRVELSTNNGASWTKIKDSVTNTNQLVIKTPASVGTQNLVRVSQLKKQSDTMMLLPNYFRGNTSYVKPHPANGNIVAACNGWPGGTSKLSSLRDERKVFIYDCNSGDTIKTFTPTGSAAYSNAYAVAWSSTGDTLISLHYAPATASSYVFIWNYNTGSVLSTITISASEAVDCDIDATGTRIAVALQKVNNNVLLYNVTSGSLLQTLAYHDNKVWRVRFNPQGTRLASCGQDNRAIIWDVSSYARLITITQPSVVTCVAWSPTQAQFVTSCSDNYSRLYDGSTGALIRTFNGAVVGTGPLYWTSFNGDGSRILSSGTSNSSRSAIWNVSSGALVTSFDFTSRVNKAVNAGNSCCYTQNGNIVTANLGYGLNLFTSSGSFVRSFARINGLVQWGSSVDFSTDGALIAITGTMGETIVYDSKTKDTVKVITGSSENPSWPFDWRASTQFSPNGQYLGIKDPDGLVRLYSTSTWTLVKSISTGSTSPAFCFSPDAQSFVVNNSLYNVSTGSLTRTFSTGINVRAICFDQTGTTAYLAGGAVTNDTGVVVRVNVNTGAVLSTGIRQSQGHYTGVVRNSSGSVLGVACRYYSTDLYDSGTLAVGAFNTVDLNSSDVAHEKACGTNGSTECRVLLFPSGNSLKTYNALHTSESYSPVLSPDGTRVFTTSQDGYLEIYDIEPQLVQSDTSDAVFSIGSPVISTTYSSGLNFGSIGTGMNKDTTFSALFCNTGSSKVRIESMLIAGANAADFSISRGAAGDTLSPGECRTIELRFAPSSVGSKSAQLQIITKCDTLKISLNGTVVQPSLQVAATIVDFGKVEVGLQKDTTVSVVVKNIGASAVTVTNTRKAGPDTTQFQILNGGGSFTLAAGASRQMQLRFAPVERGLTNGLILFDYAGVGSPAVAMLLGEGLRLARANANAPVFDNLTCHVSYRDTTITLSSFGTDDLIVSDTSISGASAAQFRILSGLRKPDTLNRTNGSRQITIRFTPVVTGNATATLNLKTNAVNLPPDSVLHISLAGRKDSIGFVIANKQILLSNVTANTAYARSAQLTNTGTVAIGWTGLPVTIGKFIIDSIAPNPTPPGQNATIYLRFSGGAKGTSYKERYIVTDTLCGRLDSLNLSATVEIPTPPTLSSLSLLGLSAIGCGVANSDSVIVISNPGDSAVVIRQMRLAGLDSVDFEILSPTSFPVSVASRDSMSIRIRFKPSSVGAKQTSLNIRSNAFNSGADSTYSIQLFCQKDSAAFSLPSSLSFTNVPSSTAQQKQLTLKNTGTSTISWMATPVVVNEFVIDSIVPKSTPVGGQSVVYITFSGGSSGQTFKRSYDFIESTCNQKITLNLTATVDIPPPTLVCANAVQTGNLLCKTELDTSVTISNTGGSDLIISDTLISGADAAAFSLPGLVLPLTIPTKQQASIRVHVRSLKVGLHSAVLDLSSNADNATAGHTQIGLSMRKDSAGFNLSPSSVSFTNVPVATAVTKTLSITNTGSIAQSWSTPLSASGFVIDSIVPSTTPPGGTSTVYVRFIGGNTGDVFNAFIDLQESACSQVHRLQLNATVNIPPPLIKVQSALGYQSVLCTTQMQDSTLTIENTGGSDLIINDTLWTGADRAYFSLQGLTLPFTVSKASSKTIIVHWMPQHNGVFNAQLDLVSNADNATLSGGKTTLTLTAQKDSSWLNLPSGSTLDFGNVAASLPQTQTISIENKGSVALSIPTGTVLGLFSIKSITPTPIPAGQNATAVIEFAGATSGSYNEQWSISDGCLHQVVVDLKASIQTQAAASAEIRCDSAVGYPGDVVNVQLHLSNQSNLGVAGVNAFELDLIYNATVVQALTADGGLSMGTSSTTGDSTTQHLVLNLAQLQNNTFGSLNFRIGLGNDSATTLRISQLKSSGGTATITSFNGKIGVLGICRSGGARLMSPNATPTALMLSPNPVTDVITLKVQSPERQLSIRVVDATGRELMCLYEGTLATDESQFDCSVKDLVSGVYSVVMQTPTEVRVYKMQVVR